MHDALGVAGATAGQPGGKDLARLRISQNDSHGANTCSDELGVLAYDTNRDLCRFRIGGSQPGKADKKQRGDEVKIYVPARSRGHRRKCHRGCSF